MSEIITDKITGKTSAGDVTITSEGGAVTMQLQQGVAKVWFHFNGTGTVSNRGTFNVSSLTDNGTGDYTESFTNNMSDQNYAGAGMSGGISGSFTDSISFDFIASPCLTSSLTMNSRYAGSTSDTERSAVQITGELA